MMPVLSLDAAGTLIHPAERVGATYARIAARHGLDADPNELDRRFAAAFATHPAPRYLPGENGDKAERAWWEELVKAVFEEEDLIDFPSFFNELFAHFASGEAWALYPDAKPFLNEAKNRGFRLIMVSNFDRRLHSICHDMDLSSYFDFILTSAEAKARKPSPLIFQMAENRLGPDPGRIHHIGDSPEADMRGPHSVGWRADLIERPKDDLLSILSRLTRPARSDA
ncbi:MAG: HAD-IA family hydrolase [Verrucomicrobiota bacterium JB023]|nr:HAD-IA family hydrolase [Verrucomicrobiota bacterium JB023]